MPDARKEPQREEQARTAPVQAGVSLDAPIEVEWEPYMRYPVDDPEDRLGFDSLPGGFGDSTVTLRDLFERTGDAFRAAILLEEILPLANIAAHLMRDVESSLYRKDYPDEVIGPLSGAESDNLPPVPQTVEHDRAEMAFHLAKRISCLAEYAIEYINGRNPERTVRAERQTP